MSGYRPQEMFVTPSTPKKIPKDVLARGRDRRLARERAQASYERRQLDYEECDYPDCWYKPGQPHTHEMPGGW